MEHPFRPLMRRRDWKTRDLSKATGFSQQHLSRVMLGRDRLSVPAARQCEERLQGAVTWQELVLWEAGPETPKARPRRKRSYEDPGPREPAEIESQEKRRCVRETARRCDCDGEPLPDLGGAA